jgi:hypothetical protein
LPLFAGELDLEGGGVVFGVLEDPPEDPAAAEFPFAPPWVEEPLVDEPDEPPGVVVVGVVAVGVVGVTVPSVLAPGEATLITWGGTAAGLESPERPIKTPTPIASSSTPTPAITATVLLRCQAPAVLSVASGGLCPGGCVGVAEACWTSPPDGGPPSRTLLIGAQRSPHSRQ